MVSIVVNHASIKHARTQFVFPSPRLHRRLEGAPLCGELPYTLVQRNQFIADGTLIKKDGFFVFTKEAEFSSPSAAAVVIYGGTANGLAAWKTKDGKSLKQLDEQA
ncbi:MAG: DUF4357 domain-containing protein [Nitrospirales bacterium]